MNTKNKLPKERQVQVDILSNTLYSNFKNDEGSNIILFCKGQSTTLEDLCAIKSRELDKTIYNNTIDYCEERNIVRAWKSQEFIEKYSNSHYNLNMWLNGNATTAYKILTSEITINDINVKTLCPNVLIKEEECIVLQRKQKVVEKYGTTVSCKKSTCRSKEVTWVSAQCRSGDEMPSVAYECRKCGHKWVSS